MNVQKTRNEESEFYKRTVFETRVFKKSFYLFPHPEGGALEQHQSCPKIPIGTKSDPL